MKSTLETQIRDAEARLFLGYGIDPIEQRLTGIRVLDFNSQAPGIPIVMLHGIASVTAVAAPLIASLARDRRLIAIDWPGHGLSDPFIVHGSLRSHAVDVLTGVLDELGIAVADVIAHSLGGQFALYFALEVPTRVRRLVLLGAPGAGFEGVKPAAAMKVMGLPGVGRLVLSLPSSTAAYLKNNEALIGTGALDGYPPEMVEVGHLASQRAGFAKSLSAYFGAILRWGRVREGVTVSPVELARISQPVMLVWGDQDVFMRPADAAASVSAIPQATLVTIAGAGHAPWLDDEAGVLAAVEPFLAASTL